MMPVPPRDPEQMSDPTGGAANRGRRAVQGSGPVRGSGAGAGGGAPEDIDGDSAGGAGGDEMPSAAPSVDEGADASSHGSR